MSRFSLDNLDTSFNARKELNIYDKPFFLDRTQSLVPRTNIKIIKTIENNETFLGISQLSYSPDLLPIEGNEIKQNVYDLPEGKMYENKYMAKVESSYVLQQRVGNILNILSK
jgi:hypothetical protein